MLAAHPLLTMLPVVDLERAREFYEDRLSLPVSEDLSSEDALVFQCGAGTLLGLYARATPTTADHTAAAWHVPDIEAAVRQLTAQGIVFEQYDFPGLQTDRHGIAQIGEERAAWFKDPEGNILRLFEIVRA